MATCGALITDDINKWIIPNFLITLGINGKVIYSPIIPVINTNNPSGKFALHSKVMNDYVSLGIHFESETLFAKRKFVLSLENTKGKKIKEVSHSAKLKKAGSVKLHHSFYKKYCLVEGLKDSDDGSMVITVEFKTPEPLSTDSKLSQDLERSFGDSSFSDIKIQCKGKIFECHRIILASRSPVLKAMCSGGFEEGATGIIKLDSEDPEIVEEMLLFIYSGKSQNLSAANAIELLKVSDIYQLDDLKKICAYNLSEKIDLSNCLRHLVFGEMYRAEQLKEKSLKFLVKNIKTVIKTDEWLEFKKKQPSLGFQVIEATVK